MKTPAPPPGFDELMQAAVLAGPERLVKVLSHPGMAAMSREYLPWDRLRYKQPPEGFTHQEWWLATRSARRMAERPLNALRDMAGRPFTYTLPDEVLRDIDEITRSASGRITISEQVTNPETRDRYLVNSLIEEAITSSQLEGAATSGQVAKDMIRTGREPVDRSERMILNNYLAMRRVRELAAAEAALTPALVREIHRIVTDGTLDNPESAGRVQTEADERVAVWGDPGQLLHQPPAAVELPERLRALCDFASGPEGDSYLHPVLKAVAVHFMVGYDHYFEDGNGRTARALFYWVMLREGYWLAEFLTISRILKNAPSQYARSFVLTEQDDGDLTHFFIYQLKIIRRAISDLHRYLSRKASELRDLQRTIRAMPGEFNYRQLALLEHAVRSPAAAYSAQSHATSHNVSTETARQDLTALEHRGLLRKSRVGKRFVWVPVVDIDDQLRSPAQ